MLLCKFTLTFNIAHYKHTPTVGVCLCVVCILHGGRDAL